MLFLYLIFIVVSEGVLLSRDGTRLEPSETPSSDLNESRKISGNIKLNGETYQTECKCVKHDQPISQCLPPVKLRVRQEQFNRMLGLSKESLHQVLGGPENWTSSAISIEHSSFHCIDGRETENILGTPGGDFGEFFNALNEYEKVISQELEQDQVLSLLHGWLNFRNNFSTTPRIPEASSTSTTSTTSTSSTSSSPLSEETAVSLLALQSNFKRTKVRLGQVDETGTKNGTSNPDDHPSEAVSSSSTSNAPGESVSSTETDTSSATASVLPRDPVSAPNPSEPNNPAPNSSPSEPAYSPPTDSTTTTTTSDSPPADSPDSAANYSTPSEPSSVSEPPTPPNSNASPLSDTPPEIASNASSDVSNPSTNNSEGGSTAQSRETEDRSLPTGKKKGNKKSAKKPRPNDELIKMYFHSDQYSLHQLELHLSVHGKSGNIVGLNLEEPPLEYQTPLLNSLIKSRYQGCDYLRAILDNPERFYVRPKLLHHLIQAYFLTLWDKETLAGDGETQLFQLLNFNVLEGSHAEKAWINFRGNAPCEHEHMAPAFRPQGVHSLYVNHPVAVQVLRATLASFFASHALPSQPLNETQLFHRFNYRGSLNMLETAALLGRDLPYYTVTVE